MINGIDLGCQSMLHILIWYHPRLNLTSCDLDVELGRSYRGMGYRQMPGDREFVRSALLMRLRMNTMSFSDVLHMKPCGRLCMLDSICLHAWVACIGLTGQEMLAGQSFGLKLPAMWHGLCKNA
jgi:hypothetical protein